MVTDISVKTVAWLTSLIIEDMDGYNKDFSNYESFTESQHKAVAFINYCKIINAMGIYEFDIGEPVDSGTPSAA